MKDFFFIINPKAGQKKYPNLLDLLPQNITYRFTERANHATELAKEAIKEGYKNIIAVGGDGTVNEVAQALLHTNANLGILPAGSGNGLARELGYAMHPSKSISQILKSKNLKNIDVGLIQGEGFEKYFFCTAGIGFDAHCAKAFSEAPARGLKTYIKVAWGAYWSYPIQEVLLNQEKQSFFSLTFANAKQFGNNAYIAPQACINDGYLNITCIKSLPFWATVGLFIRLFFKTIHRSNQVKTMKEKRFQVLSKENILIHYDGEPFETKNKQIEITIIPKALNVIIPNEIQ